MRIILPLKLLLFASCATTIQCPALDKSNDSMLLALVDHGRHTSLIFEFEKQKMIRYSYGDWQYYALNKASLWSGIKALFWPTQAALGRKQLHGYLTKELIEKLLFVHVEDILIFNVNRQKAIKLIKSLDKFFQKASNSKKCNSYYDLEFVQYPAQYHLFKNSNYKVAQWMEKLECQTYGISIFSDWKKQ